LKLPLALLIGTLLLSSGSPALAAGFALAEQGAAASGNASAHTAVADSADSAFFNPSLNALAPGLKTSLGASFLFAGLEHDGDVLTQTESPPGTPPTLKFGYAHPFQNLNIGGTIYAGVPYGSGVQWPGSWPGRFDITSIALRVYELNANAVVGYRIDDLTFALGGGPRLLRSTVGLTRKIDAVENEADVELAGVGSSLAWQASGAAQLKGATLGVSYRSGVTANLNGRAHFQDVPVELSGVAQDQNVNTSVALPSRLAIGISYNFGPGQLAFDTERYGWSTFKTFGINFENPDTPNVNEPRNWEDTWAFRLGYSHTGLAKELVLRAGLAWDPTPAPANTLSPTLPDSNRSIGTLGAGWTFPINLQINAAYGLMVLQETAPTNPEVLQGKIRGNVHMFSFGVAWHLDSHSP